MSYLFLSYELSDAISGYGNGKRIEVTNSRQMCCGDTSNNTEFWMPTHFGTHLDYPYHFSKSGKKGSDFSPETFVFNHIEIQELDLRYRENKLILPSDINQSTSLDTELLIIKTFYSSLRDSDDYWRNGPGFAPETARRLKEIFPKLRAIAFDSISLTNFQNRELGRVAHKSFLIEEEILIIEDVDLKEVSDQTQFNQIVVSPLRFSGADGAPVTIFAKVN